MNMSLNKRTITTWNQNVISKWKRSSLRTLLFISFTLLVLSYCYSNPAGLKENKAILSISDVVIVLKEYESGKVHVKWSVNLEDQFVKSKLERSKDGKNFESINSINHIVGMNTFSFYDKSAHLGKSYYRLKVYYADGTYDYSTKKSIRLLRKKINEHFLYPNPVSIGGVVQIKDYRNSEGKIQVFNMQGQLVISNSNLSNGKLDVSALKAGSYVVVLNQENTSRRQILIKN